MILATVSGNSGFHRDVRTALKGHLCFDTTLELAYSDTTRLRGLGAAEKLIAIIDFTEPARAMPVARAVDGRAFIATIAVNTGGTREELVALMAVGVRDVLPHFAHRKVLEAAHRAAAKLGCAGELVGDLSAFVPAKPGCGATTVATYSTEMSARLSGQPTLLLDFDIRSGLTTFLLKAEGTRTVSDALLIAHRLETEAWNGLVSQIDNLHLLGSGPIDFSSPLPPERFTELIDFAVRQYSAVTVDLPGSMESHECETLLRAKQIFLVCAPEIGALHVARRKSDWLRDLRLTNKVSVVLNCMKRRNAFSVADIERIIQLPVHYVLPAGHSEVARAIQKGSMTEGSSPLARQIARIAGDMAAVGPYVRKPDRMRRLIEYFSFNVTSGGQGWFRPENSGEGT